MSNTNANDVFLKKHEEKEVEEIHENIETTTEQQDEYNNSQFKMLRLLNEALSQKISRYNDYSTTVNSSDDESECDDDNMSLISYDSLDFSFDEV